MKIRMTEPESRKISEVRVFDFGFPFGLLVSSFGLDL
jgi:hypothetical protein